MKDERFIPLTVDNLALGKIVVFKTTYGNDISDKNIALGVVLDAELTLAPDRPAHISNVKVRWETGVTFNYNADQLLIERESHFFHKPLIEKQDDDPNRAFKLGGYDESR